MLLFFHFKKWCKIIFQKSPLTSVLSCVEQLVKFIFKKMHFSGRKKVHFIQKCSVTQNTVFQYVKNIFCCLIKS